METWFAVVDGAGNLVSTGTVLADPTTLAVAGYSSLQLASDPTGQVWDASTRTFSAGPKKPTVLSVWSFIQRFTPDEFAAVDASNDHQVKQFMLMLTVAQSITPSDTVVQNGLQYLVQKNLLTATRATTIGAS